MEFTGIICKTHSFSLRVVVPMGGASAHVSLYFRFGPVSAPCPVSGRMSGLVVRYLVASAKLCVLRLSFWSLPVSLIYVYGLSYVESACMRYDSCLYCTSDCDHRTILDKSNPDSHTCQSLHRPTSLPNLTAYHNSAENVFLKYSTELHSFFFCCYSWVSNKCEDTDYYLLCKGIFFFFF